MLTLKESDLLLSPCTNDNDPEEGLMVPIVKLPRGYPDLQLTENPPNNPCRVTTIFVTSRAAIEKIYSLYFILQ